MEPEARRKLIEVYESALQRHGPTVRAVLWDGDASQQTRFRVLSEVGPWEGASVADIGCGLGDFYGFLRDRGHRVAYTGYDIAPAMVEAARLKYPEALARFEVRDILEDGLPGPFDYLVASGTFNIRLENHEEFLRQMLSVMYSQCRRAVAFNALHPMQNSHPRFAELQAFCGDFYYEVGTEELLALCRTVCPHVEVRESSLYEETSELSYKHRDCTVFMYKDEADAAVR